jgi:hypothetical protein
MHPSKWNIIYLYIVITLLLIDVLACMIGYGLMVVTSIPNKNELTIRYSHATGVCLGVPPNLTEVNQRYVLLKCFLDDVPM